MAPFHCDVADIHLCNAARSVFLWPVQWIIWSCGGVCVASRKTACSACGIIPQIENSRCVNKFLEVVRARMLLNHYLLTRISALVTRMESKLLSH